MKRCPLFPRKGVYYSEEEAELAAKKRTEQTGIKIRSYECSDEFIPKNKFRHWHLTSRKRPVRRKLKAKLLRKLEQLFIEQQESTLTQFKKDK